MINRIKSRMKSLWYKTLMWRVSDIVQVLRMYYGPHNMNFASLNEDIVPENVRGFEDLSYLFASHQANRGVIAMDFDEASYLWKVITQRRPGKILEVGRWLGGSTTLICSAASQYEGGEVVSVDLKVKAPNYALDSLIEKHLQRLGLNNFKLFVGSSFDFDPGMSIDLVFIDGDHSYEGAKKDFKNAMKYLSTGGDILFHDSCETRPFATYHDQVAKLMDEVKKNKEFTLVREVGSLTHFRSSAGSGEPGELSD